MDTCIRSVEQVQHPSSARRPTRRWPRRGPPLRWGAREHNRHSATTPGGGGSGPPSADRSSIPHEDATWLASLRPWAIAFVRRFKVRDADCEDVVQEAFTRAAVEWAEFVAPDELPAWTARRRWIADILVRAARRVRDKAYRARKHAPYDLDRALNVIGARSHEGPLAARQFLQGLKMTTTPERWRIWVSHEVDEVSVPEVARQEGRPVGTIYNQLRLARQDLAAALGRDAATEAGPLMRRGASVGRKPRE